jgi:hypothetical protein
VAEPDLVGHVASEDPLGRVEDVDARVVGSAPDMRTFRDAIPSGARPNADRDGGTPSHAST